MGSGESLLAEVWPLLYGPGIEVPSVRVAGGTGLAGPLPVSELAVGAVAAQLAAARRLRAGGGPVEVDAAHVGLAVRSERYAAVAGRLVAPGFHPLSRFWRTADGWLRLHANYPHHRAAALHVLGGPGDDVGTAAARWAAVDLESAVVAAGGAAAAVRTAQEWAATAQGRAVAAAPPVGLRRSAPGPLRAPALEGLRVLDLTRVIAGPVATRTLASHGADVVRLDGPRLPDDPGGLVDTGVGKRHAVLDLAAATDRRTAEELLGAADVVVQGYRPGALARFGLDPAALAERHPHLVVVSLSAWGTAGPWGGRRGFDSLVQAASGIAVECGTPEAPGVLPAQALDHATGHLAAAAVLAALTRQRVEGGGWHGELSLARTAHWLLGAARPPGDAGGEGVDPGRYLLRLPSPAGEVTVVAPPGSPPWGTASVSLGDDSPFWRPGPRTDGFPRRAPPAPSRILPPEVRLRRTEHREVFVRVHVLRSGPPPGTGPRGRGRSTALVASGVLAGGVIAMGLVANAATDGSREESSVSQGGDRVGGHRGERLLTGYAAEQVTDAALEEYPGATIRRVETDSDGVYEAHLVTTDGHRVTVEVGADFRVTGLERHHR